MCYFHFHIWQLSWLVFQHAVCKMLSYYHPSCDRHHLIFPLQLLWLTTGSWLITSISWKTQRPRWILSSVSWTLTLIFWKNSSKIRPSRNPPEVMMQFLFYYYIIKCIISLVTQSFGWGKHTSVYREGIMVMFMSFYYSTASAQVAFH